MNFVRKRFWSCLGALVLAALAIELLIRPLFPQWVPGESAMLELMKLVPAVLAGMGI